MIQFLEPNIKSTSVILYWTAIPEAQSFSLRFRPKKDDNFINISTRFRPSTLNNISNRGKSQLLPDTEYVFELRAHLATSDSNWVSINIKTPADNTVKIKPCPEVNITKVDVGLDYVSLEWDAVTLEGVANNLITYTVRSRRSDSLTNFQEVVNTNSYKRTLPKNTNYILEVRAIAPNNNFSDWVKVEVKTDKDILLTTKEIKEFLKDFDNGLSTLSKSSYKVINFLNENWDGGLITKEDLK